MIARPHLRATFIQSSATRQCQQTTPISNNHTLRRRGLWERGGACRAGLYLCMYSPKICMFCKLLMFSCLAQFPFYCKQEGDRKEKMAAQFPMRLTRKANLLPAMLTATILCTWLEACNPMSLGSSKVLTWEGRQCSDDVRFMSVPILCLDCLCTEVATLLV